MPFRCHRLPWWPVVAVHPGVYGVSFCTGVPVLSLCISVFTMSLFCTGGASCLVRYMQVSVASFAVVAPLVAVLHAGVYGIICTGGLLHKCLSGGVLTTGGHRGFHSQH